MRRRHIAPFFFVVADRDHGIFTVEGPMTDDTAWNSAVCAAQKEGRQITCCNGGSNRSRAETEYAQAYGLRLEPPGSIIHPSLPRGLL